MIGRALLALAALVVGSAPVTSRAESAKQIATEEFMIDSDTAGIKLYVRNKRPADMQSFSPERTLLYVHGSTYPSETAFDLRLNGVSWIEYLA
jgi:hypothetical protein